MDRFPLICAPTPLHSLPRLSERLGIDLWIKRDDLTGFALGGNKGRKLEFLIAQAISSGADTVVTCGATQSNFIRQLGAACAVAGLRCVAVVMDLPYEDAPPSGPRLGTKGGNALLGRLLGVETVRLPDSDWDSLYAATEAQALSLESSGHKVYRIPVGGSSPLGAYAFVEAAREIGRQTSDFDCIIFASSSGSTQVGLSWHFRDRTTRILGIACDPEPEIVHDFADLSRGLAELLEQGDPMKADEFEMNFDFVGSGYGTPSPEGQAAIKLMARTEGIFLDPIYTGKAFAGLIALARQGELPKRVLFWHTGGVPALFA